MSAWPGKYIIGLTGNIATGKSSVRRMLEELGAYGIDADAVAHRAMLPGAPGYLAVIREFGNQIVSADRQINRRQLGQIVFSDPAALARLEAIIHPQVTRIVAQLIRQAAPYVIVVEAIKLIESGLNKRCDSVWVTVTPIEIRLARLTQYRGMDIATARQRIEAQSPQRDKVALADVVIYNSGLLEDTRRQVKAAWEKFVPHSEKG